MAERSDVKAEEVRKACGILGFQDVYFFGEDDAVLLMNEDTVRRLAAMLRQLKPDIVLTHFPREGDRLLQPPCHCRADHPVRDQLRRQRGSGRQQPAPSRGPGLLLRLRRGGDPPPLWDAEGGYYNDVFIDITDVVEKKLAAMDCLVSQGYGGAYARKRIETSDGAFGQAGGVAYG